MAQVFTPEAMAICAARGHAWRTVRTWHDVSHLECSRCGETPGLGGAATADRAEGAESVAPPSRAVAGPRRQRYADATPTSDEGAKLDMAPRRPWEASAQQRRERDLDIARRVAAGEQRKAIAEHYGLNPSRIAQIMHSLKQPLPPRGSANESRDAEIRTRVAAGESRAAVAAEFGVSVARVYQIAPRGHGASSS